jgi:uncharacterized protein
MGELRNRPYPDREIQRRVVDALSGPDAFGGESAPAEVLETHISYVFLTPGRAYKLKKAIVLPFVDYGTRERRRDMCLEEVRLNRRLAPSTYLGVRAVVPAGGGFALADGGDARAVEHVVEMVRFKAAHTLDARVASGSATRADVERVAARIAAFHAGLPPAEGGAEAVAAVRAAAGETFSTLRSLGAPERAVRAGSRFSETFLAARGGDLVRRAEAGLVREGHGDLRAEHVILDGAVQVVDCVEFDPALRTVDVGADLSFLYMDLERLGSADLAGALLRAYRAAGGDPGDVGLVAFHAAQRAWVRAKVALIQRRRGEADVLLALGRRLAWRARGPLLLVVCGLSGSGKTTLAAELGTLSGLPVLSSDVVRKRLAGLDPEQRARPEHYGEEFSRRTYDELGRLAARRLEAGRGVVVDATFRRAAERALFLARLPAIQPLFVECTAPDELRVGRLEERAPARSGGSDATPEVAAGQRFEPLAEAAPGRHLVLRTERPPAELADEVESWLDGAQACTGATVRWVTSTSRFD